MTGILGFTVGVPHPTKAVGLVDNWREWQLKNEMRA